MGVSPSGLGALIEAFEENFRRGAEMGASVSVWWRGEEVLSLGRGWCERECLREWTSETLIPVYSATKAAASASLLLALEQKGLGCLTKVREVWPKFPLEEATFGDLLSHQCGLAALDRKACIWEHEEVVAALEAQRPAWRPGHGHGYHPRTFGAMVAEPVRRLTGMHLADFWRETVMRPMAMDLWIGLPEEEWGRVARLYPGRAKKGAAKDRFYREFNREGSLTQRAFGSPDGLRSVHEMNQPKAWAAGFSALGGVASARGLAMFYQAAIGAIPSPLTETVRKALACCRVQGEDQILMQQTAFSAGCQLDPLGPGGEKLRQLYGPEVGAFGHPGAGGSHAFGDPSGGLSFAYVMNQMELSVMPGPRSTRLIEALYD